MKFISICSGIEAASVAFGPLGWKAIAFSEIEPFPCAVLAHHYPDVPNFGDMTKFREWPEEIFANADAIVGGPPCQAFSVAGLRNGLNDDRGNLTLTYAELINHADAIRTRHGKPPVVVLYENVPGLLSDKTGAFGCFLGAIAGEDGEIKPPGGKWTNAGCVSGPQRALAWAVTDAQFFGVAQRRRRVFVVASARKGFNPAAILFEPESVRRDTPPSREAGEGAAACAGAGAACSGGSEVTPFDWKQIGHPANFSNPKPGDPCHPIRAVANAEPAIITMAHGQGGAEIGFDRGPTLTCIHEAPIAAYSTSGAGYWRDGIGALRGRPQDSHENVCCVTGEVTHTLKAEGFDASEDGTGRGQPIVAHCRDVAQTITRNYGKQVDNSDTALGPNVIAVHGTQDPCVSTTTAFALGRNNGGENAIAFSCKDHGGDAGSISPTLRSMGHDGSHANAGGQVAVAMRESGQGYWMQDDIAGTLRAEGEDRPSRPSHVVAQPVLAFAATGQAGAGWAPPSFPVSEECSQTLDTRRAQSVLAPVAFSCKDHGGDAGPLSPTLRSMGYDGSHANAGGQVAVCFTDTRGDDRGSGIQVTGDIANTMHCAKGPSEQQCVAVAFAQNSRNELRLEGGDGHCTGALSAGGGKPGQGMPAVAVSLRGRDGGATAELGDEVGNCLRASGGGGDKAHVLAPVAAGTDVFNGNITGYVAATMGTSGSIQNASWPTVMQAMQVRRLTPRECERLQGFPDDYTLIPWKAHQAWAKKNGTHADGKSFEEWLIETTGRGLRQPTTQECPDGPRYKALGNSWAVPNVRWIGRRIDAALRAD